MEGGVFIGFTDSNEDSLLNEESFLGVSDGLNNVEKEIRRDDIRIFSRV